MGSDFTCLAFLFFFNLSLMLSFIPLLVVLVKDDLDSLWPAHFILADSPFQILQKVELIHQRFLNSNLAFESAHFGKRVTHAVGVFSFNGLYL